MNNSINLGKNFLLWYAHDLKNFRIPELKAITSCFGIKFEWHEQPSINHPYILINLSSSLDIKKIMSRTVLIRSAYELWCTSDTKDDLHSKLKLLPKKFTEAYFQPDASFRIMVETFGKKMSRDMKIKRIEELSFLNFGGPINLKYPHNSYLLMEYYGTDANRIPDNPYKLFFGRWICDGQRKISQKLSLRFRKFIGNTSMDPLLSLIMANMAKINSGNLVLDPFVGSGGLLVAAAHFGGYVLGTDIDYLMLHGRAKPTRSKQKVRDLDENIQTNLAQYGLESRYLDALVVDSSLPLWRNGIEFDAIITDPPYGIREPTERIGTDRDYKIPDHLAASHIPSKVAYNLQNIIRDLLEFSAGYLKLHGRLVYWMPSYKEDFDKNNLPHHPCLELISYCEQPLTTHSSRFLITMEKVKEYIDDHKNKASVGEAAISFRSKYFQAVERKNGHFHEKLKTTIP